MFFSVGKSGRARDGLVGVVHHSKRSPRGRIPHIATLASSTKSPPPHVSGGERGRASFLADSLRCLRLGCRRSYERSRAARPLLVPPTSPSSSLPTAPVYPLLVPSLLLPSPGSLAERHIAISPSSPGPTSLPRALPAVGRPFGGVTSRGISLTLQQPGHAPATPESPPRGSRPRARRIGAASASIAPTSPSVDVEGLPPLVGKLELATEVIPPRRGFVRFPRRGHGRASSGGHDGWHMEDDMVDGVAYSNAEAALACALPSGG